MNFLGGRIVLGAAFSGYKIGIFEAGTTTAKTTYKDSAYTVGNENAHPVVLDSRGAAQIWFSGNAKAILYTSADAVVYTDDNINVSSSSTESEALFENSTLRFIAETNRSRLDTIIDNADAILAQQVFS